MQPARVLKQSALAPSLVARHTTGKAEVGTVGTPWPKVVLYISWRGTGKGIAQTPITKAGGTGEKRLVCDINQSEQRALRTKIRIVLRSWSHFQSYFPLRNDEPRTEFEDPPVARPGWDASGRRCTKKGVSA